MGRWKKVLWVFSALLIVVLVTELTATTIASADVIFYDEDFGDRGTYPNGSPALHTGEVEGQQPWDYDTYAYPSNGKLFSAGWHNVGTDPLQGYVVDIGGQHGQVLQVWYTGQADIGWGAVLHNAFVGMFRPVHDLPFVVEVKFRPQYYDPQPIDENENPAPGTPRPWQAAWDMDGAQFSFEKETALKWRFYTDSFVVGADYRLKYRLYYDGTVAQKFRDTEGWATVDIGGYALDENGYIIPGGGASEFSHFVWDPCANGVGEWLEYRCFHDPVTQEIRIYLTDEDNPLTPIDKLSRDENGNPVRDGNGNVLDENGNIWDGDKLISQFTVSPGNNGMEADEELVYNRIRQIGMFNGGADQTAFWDEWDEFWYGDPDYSIEELDGSKGEFDDVFACYLGRPTWTERISGTLTIEYPYYCHYKLLGFEWQLRPPAGGGEPKKPVVYGVEDLQLWDSPVYLPHGVGTAEPDIPIVRDYTIGLVPAGTYDLSFKQINHLAYTIQNLVVPSTTADFTLYAGDAGGDFVNFYDTGSAQGISRPDNDCDSWDLATVTTEEACGYTYCKKHPATGLSIFSGESGDFDNDQLVTTWDLAAATSNQGRIAYGKWYFQRNLKGTATIEFPGWLCSTMPLDYQVRQPGLPPTTPLYQGTVDDPDDVMVTHGDHPCGYPATAEFQIAIPGIAPVRPSTIDGLGSGTYDLALKHANHLAYVVEIVIPLADSKVEDITGYVFWAGDADGDDNVFTIYPDDPKGDNDVDLTDYYTLYYQYQGGLPLTIGYNADFNCDGIIDLCDYYGLYYGYQNAANPGNWYFP